MVYFILIFGCLIGVYALYRFFMVATKEQITAAFKTASFIIFAVALLFLSVTGRLPAALALLGVVSPFIANWLRQKYFPSKPPTDVIDLGEAEIKDDDNDNKET
tara:strand:+ start:2121 stop:2432 length:312 start_codon:yes stop_codon:yes gene_type:complete